MSGEATGRATRRAAAALLAVLLAGALLGSGGCGVVMRLTGRAPERDIAPPDAPAGIIGVIKSYTQSTAEGGVIGVMLVEGGARPTGAAPDKAAVTVREETAVVRAGRWMPAQELVVGMRVRVWFEGPVAESYPVQGTASFIEVQ